MKCINCNAEYDEKRISVCPKCGYPAPERQPSGGGEEDEEDG